MNDNAKLWVEALRSGDFQQAKKSLHVRGENGEPDSYCCLGVACELYLDATEGLGLTKQMEYMPEMARNIYTYDNSTGILPKAVQSWLGLQSRVGEFQRGDRDFSSLGALNDDGKSFDEIADVIESEPRFLFGPPKEMF